MRKLLDVDIIILEIVNVVGAANATPPKPCKMLALVSQGRGAPDEISGGFAGVLLVVIGFKL